MANIFKRVGKDGRGTWYIRYRNPNGKDIRRATKAKTKREAQALLRKVNREIEDNTYDLKQRLREVMFFEICEDFQTYGQAHKRSWKRDRNSINHLKGFFGDCLAASIRPVSIENYILHRKKSFTSNGKNPTPATINRELACLRTMFNRAIRNEKCERNPMDHIRFLKENNIRDRVLAPDELKMLLDASPEHLKPIIITAYETGMRAGEIFGLSWKQIDLKQGMISLKPEQTKTNEGRKIPISIQLHEILSQIRKESGPVFRYNGDSIHSIRRSFRRACENAGIRNFRFHDFRHTFVTRMRRAGIHDHVIMAITGHKTRAMFRRYDTVDENDLKNAITTNKA